MAWVLLLFVSSALAQSTSGKIDVLIVDGFSNHDWKQTTEITRMILEESKLFNVSVSTIPSDTTNAAWRRWNPKFSSYDVIIQNTNNINNEACRWPRHVEKALEKYVAGGGGLYILHSANNAFSDWEEYNIMIGLGWRAKDQGVALQVNNYGEVVTIPSGKGKATYHGPREDEIIYILNDHPINTGFPKAWKTPDMELYKYARGPAENLAVLSYAKDEKTDLNWPVDWVISYGKGRVYNSSMGHLWKGMTYPLGYRCIGFQTVMIRALEWLAMGKTTYALPADFPTATTMNLSPEKTDIKRNH
ncbi:MAG: ThuA domain-containing protein [Bacteroidota bacterium]